METNIATFSETSSQQVKLAQFHTDTEEPWQCCKIRHLLSWELAT